MSLLTYLDPNAIKDASIEGIKIKNGTISSSKIDGTVASKSYVDNKVTNAVKVTYTELKSLRDAGKLVAGTQYRITDYTCTTTQVNTKSAGHVFDIIVTADDESTLNEEARAALHSGDTYFANSNLSAWKLWYCLDNDTERFYWANVGKLTDTIKPITGNASGTYTYSSPISKIKFLGEDYNLKIGVRTKLYGAPPTYITKTDDYTLVVEDEYNFVTARDISVYTEGKGVIYRMIDEFNNDCPYDFKNIQFYRKWDSSKSLWSTISSDSTGVPCYTFSSSGNSATTSFTDMSLSASNNVYSNVIVKYVSNKKQTLNNNCFFGNNCYSNTFGNDCQNNTFGNNCNSNTFGNNCNSNTFGNNFRYNTFGNYCQYNSFGNNFRYNTFGNYCQYNSFGNNCNSNTFGNNCNSNTFKNDCDSNSFGNYCDSNFFKYVCRNNTFENGCQYNTFGDNCSGNFFENSCQNNTFGNNCSSNFFGNSCWYNSFKNNCDSNSFGSSCSVNTLPHFCRYNFFGDGCYKLNVQNSDTASSEQQVQNYVFANGLNRSASTQMTIITTRNLSYETKVAKNSNGDLKIYCGADLIL